MENTIFEHGYAIDTFYFLICGALVMWMAAGFAMLEAGLVRSKNTTEILTKNVALYAISCTMFMLVGYSIMYPDLGNVMLSGIIADGVKGAAEPATYAPSADFFFQVVFVATSVSIRWRILGGLISPDLALCIWLEPQPLYRVFCY